MIVAVDTNVVLDCLVSTAEHHASSLAYLRSMTGRGHELVACEIVWAEVATGSNEPSDVVDWMRWLGITFDPLDADAAIIAASAWRRYREDGGSRQRLVPDFLVGAHAVSRARALATRDRGFQGRYFPELQLLDPSAA